MVKNPNHKFMEQNLSMVINRMQSLGVWMSAHVKVQYKFHIMFLQTHQDILYLKQIFQDIKSKYLDALNHLQNQPASVDNTETTISQTPNSQDCSKRSILSGLGQIVVTIFGCGSSGGYSHAIIDEIKKNLHILQEHQNLQSRQIKDEFAPINLTRVN